MASRKRSTLSDIDGAGVPKRLRAEGVHDSHERDTEALTEATNNAPLGEETRAVTSEQQGATDKGGEPYEDDATTAPAGSAASKVLYTTELLEQIISYLSSPALIAAANVDKFIFNCAVNSPDIQETMCLRSSIRPRPQCYRIHRTGSVDCPELRP